MTVMTSREFNQDTGKAKKAAHDGPVFITDHAKTTHVLLSIEEYQKLTEPRRTLIDMLSMPAEDYFEFELPPRERSERPVDLED